MELDFVKEVIGVTAAALSLAVVVIGLFKKLKFKNQ
jgi:hypothetical protein